MEQITRDEMIELLRANRATVKDYQNGLFDAHVTPGGYVEPGEISRDLEGYQKQIEQIDSAISALQAAEPVAWIEIRDCDCEECEGEQDVTTDPLWAKHYPDRWTPLFTLPCPPTTELAPESWREELETIAEILEADGDEWHCAARIRKMLTASPAPDHSGGGNEMVEVPFHKLALGTRFRYTSILESEYVKISATQVARWQDDMAIAGWAGQGVYSFDEKDGTDTKVLVAVPIGLRQQEEAER